MSNAVCLSRTTVWLTGLPCSGKTTLSIKLKETLDGIGIRTVCLDADDMRNKLNDDLGFSPADRKENLRRSAHVARLFNDNGNCVIASFVSPTEEYRNMIKKIIGNVILIYVKCSLVMCETRDVKGMYKKARSGELREFTGVSSPFEEPADADIVVDTERMNAHDCVREILNQLKI
ncbi:MAG: adenylyl-sulfate kinase [Candidatus Omnitrophica bacterium]|nr:adenylyl-sulfate kinase [Candidatus Omnitrophota bacterium]